MDKLDETSPMMARLKGEIDRYAKNRESPNKFVCAVIANDLRDAIVFGKENEIRIITKVVHYVHWNVPHEARGSYSSVEKWTRRSKDNLCL